jgi:hypothetical protein
MTQGSTRPELLSGYLNAQNKSGFAEFVYVFKFDDVYVEYVYRKTSVYSLIYEQLKIDGKIVAYFDRAKKKAKPVFDLLGAASLKSDILFGDNSIISYIRSNTYLDDGEKDSLFFSKFYDFVERMLFFKPIENMNSYISLSGAGGRSVSSEIIKNKLVNDFEDFLNKAGILCKVSAQKDVEGEEKLYFDFGSKKILFFENASTGTKALSMFYFWLMSKRLNTSDEFFSFAFIDEFDAYYHKELSQLVVERLKNMDLQVVLTTHNTSIMSNELMRPDCYFVMNQSGISSLGDLTEKELRFAHNLEKMYKAGAFEIEE